MKFSIDNISKPYSKAYIYIEEIIHHDAFLCLQGSNFTLCIGDETLILSYIEEMQYHILHSEVHARQSIVPLLDISQVAARIEYGAIIREHVTLEAGCIILMGAVLNVGSRIGELTMVDMNAVIGSSAQIGKRCHIGAGAVVSGTLEPAGPKEVIIEDDVFIGANATILSGVHIHRGAVIGAGSVVLHDVKENEVVAGNPAKFIKFKDEIKDEKININEDLR